MSEQPRVTLWIPDNGRGRTGDEDVPGAPRLTEKQQRFVEAYAGPAKGNATEAARLAGYSGDTNTLSSTGYELLRNPDVAEALAAIEAKVRHKGLMTIEDVQAAMESIWLGTWRTAEGLPPSEKSQTDALDRLARMKGGYLERHQVTHQGAAMVKVYLPDNGRDPT